MGKEKIKLLLLPEEIRKELKTPWGQLITEAPTQTLIQLIKEHNPPLVIMVGDYCVDDALKQGLIPNFAIIDGLNLRKPYQEISIANAKVIKSTNPPATITIETWEIIRKQLKKMSKQLRLKKTTEPIVLAIDGEEDLLFFPVVLEAPNKSFVVYGQPHEGIVVTIVTANTKLKCKKLIERMKVEK